ncbi:MAG: hypothetical protein R3195_17275 [Gemmatimonadota bacterium]|nr:hypothetical protein [Gemmatimonadota bacterium]
MSIARTGRAGPRRDARASIPRPGAWLLLVGLLLSATASCEPAGDASASGVLVGEDTDGTRLVTGGLPDLEALPEWTLSAEPTIEIGAVEGAPGHDLFNVRSAFLLSDGRLVIANGGSHELRIYSATGEHRGGFGGEGGGPGEFTSIQRADPVRGDSILVFDQRARRLSLFDGEGAFVSEGRLPAGGVPSFSIATGVLDSGRTVTLTVAFGEPNGESGLRRDTATVRLHERDGTVVDTLGRLPGTEVVSVQAQGLAMITTRAFGRGEFARAGGSTIVLGTNDAYSFEILDETGAVSARVVVDVPGCPTTDAEFDEWLESQFDREQDGFREVAREIAAAAPRHETHPPFQTLDVYRTGDVWIGRRVCGGEAVDFTVFEPDGLPVGRLTLEEGGALLDVGDDYVAVRVRDELEREIVRVHRLERP